MCGSRSLSLNAYLELTAFMLADRRKSNADWPAEEGDMARSRKVDPGSGNAAVPNGGEVAGSDASAGNCPSRRMVDIPGFGVLEDGRTISLVLVEISYEGCKIRTDIALFPGLELKISTLSTRGTVSGRVRWNRDGHAGIEFIPDPILLKAPTPRSHPRVSLNASVSIRRVGRPAYRTALLDLTPAGCKIEFIESPRRGDLVWVKFADLQAIEASVAWVEGFVGGLKFTRPLHAAIFDRLVARLTS